MNTFLEFLRKYYYIFLFFILEAISGVLLFRFNSYQGSVWFTAANSVAAYINNFYAEGKAFIEMKDVNAYLTYRNTLLQEENNYLRSELMKTQKSGMIQDSVMQSVLKNYRIIPARVVSNSVMKQNNYFVIDKGKEDGISPEMGVVSGGGVAGIVYLTSPHHSLVIPIINLKSNISCRIRGQRYFGFLQWSGFDPRNAYVTDIPRYAKINKNDIIETSGYSAVFPPGIFVGRVLSRSKSNDGQSFKINVLLGTDFAKLRDVNVIVTPYKAECDTLREDLLEKEIEDNSNG